MDRIIAGPSAEGKIPLIPVHEYLWEHLARFGDNTCVVNATTNTSYSGNDIIRRSKCIAKGLGEMNLQKGDILTCYGVNSPEYMVTIIGSLAAGLSMNTINPAATKYELRHYFKQVQPKLIYTEEQLLENVEAAKDVIKQEPTIILRHPKRGYKDLAELSAETHETNRITQSFDAKNDIAYILFSSGTTGLPKAVMLTHYNVVSHSFLRQNLGNEAAGFLLSVFPMYHVAGLLGGMQQCAVEGHPIIIMEKYDLRLVLESIQRYKVSILQIPPSVLVQLAKTPLYYQYDVSSVRMCGSGAAPIKSEMERIFKDRFNNIPIRNGYGLTESTGGVLYKTAGVEDQRRPGCSGKPDMGTSIKLIDVDTGELLGPHQRGELLVHSPRVMKGYLHNPQATREVIDEKGWLHTGDLAYCDEQGYIYIVDRIKELIKYKGNQVAPAELEAVLLEHKDVSDVGVVGVPDSVAGELPRAYIVKRESSGLTEQHVMDFVKDKVSYYKRLSGGVVFVDEIPKLASGKILRRKLLGLEAQKSKL